MGSQSGAKAKSPHPPKGPAIEIPAHLKKKMEGERKRERMASVNWKFMASTGKGDYIWRSESPVGKMFLGRPPSDAKPPKPTLRLSELCNDFGQNIVNDLENPESPEFLDREIQKVVEGDADRLNASEHRVTVSATTLIGPSLETLGLPESLIPQLKKKEAERMRRKEEEKKFRASRSGLLQPHNTGASHSLAKGQIGTNHVSSSSRLRLKQNAETSTNMPTNSILDALEGERGRRLLAKAKAREKKVQRTGLADIDLEAGGTPQFHEDEGFYKTTAQRRRDIEAEAQRLAAKDEEMRDAFAQFQRRAKADDEKLMKLKSTGNKGRRRSGGHWVPGDVKNAVMDSPRSINASDGMYIAAHFSELTPRMNAAQNVAESAYEKASHLMEMADQERRGSAGRGRGWNAGPDRIGSYPKPPATSPAGAARRRGSLRRSSLNTSQKPVPRPPASVSARSSWRRRSSGAVVWYRHHPKFAPTAEDDVIEQEERSRMDAILQGEVATSSMHAIPSRKPAPPAKRPPVPGSGRGRYRQRPAPIDTGSPKWLPNGGEEAREVSLMEIELARVDAEADALANAGAESGTVFSPTAAQRRQMAAFDDSGDLAEDFTVTELEYVPAELARDPDFVASETVVGRRKPGSSEEMNVFSDLELENDEVTLSSQPRQRPSQVMSDFYATSVEKVKLPPMRTRNFVPERAGVKYGRYYIPVGKWWQIARADAYGNAQPNRQKTPIPPEDLEKLRVAKEAEMARIKKQFFSTGGMMADVVAMAAAKNRGGNANSNQTGEEIPALSMYRDYLGRKGYQSREFGKLFKNAKLNL